MHTHRRIPLAVLIAAIFISPMPLRGQELAGDWLLEIPRHQGGTAAEEPIRIGLTFEQTGESVRATWLALNPPPHITARPRVLNGTFRDGQLVLTDTTEAVIQGPAGMNDVLMEQRMELRREDDRLVGTQTSSALDGSIRPMSRPLTIVRRSAAHSAS